MPCDAVHLQNLDRVLPLSFILITFQKYFDAFVAFYCQ